MQKSVEDEKTWGGSSVALEEMGVAVLAGAYNIESEEVQRRTPSGRQVRSASEPPPPQKFLLLFPPTRPVVVSSSAAQAREWAAVQRLALAQARRNI